MDTKHFALDASAAAETIKNHPMTQSVTNGIPHYLAKVMVIRLLIDQRTRGYKHQTRVREDLLGVL